MTLATQVDVIYQVKDLSSGKLYTQRAAVFLTDELTIGEILKNVIECDMEEKVMSYEVVGSHETELDENILWLSLDALTGTHEWLTAPIPAI